jgi:predicted transcriptional regulator
LKKILISISAIIVLLIAFYSFKPIQAAIEKQLRTQISQVTRTGNLSSQEMHDSLVVISLGFRHQNRMDLAWLALNKADSILPDHLLTKGLIGLYHLEGGQNRKTIESWKRGAAIKPDDPNFSYLARLSESELRDVDNHMLEKLFVDTITNSRLKVGVYHPPDNIVVAQVEKKLRIEGSINNTFYLSSLAGAIVLIVGFIGYKKRKKSAVPKAQVKKESSFTKSVGYMVLISALIKGGQIVATMFNYYLLGTDISDALSKYIITPNSIMEIARDNVLFGIVIVIVIIGALFRKKIVRAKQLHLG